MDSIKQTNKKQKLPGLLFISLLLPFSTRWQKRGQDRGWNTFYSLVYYYEIILKAGNKHWKVAPWLNVHDVSTWKHLGENNNNRLWKTQVQGWKVRVQPWMSGPGYILLPCAVGRGDREVFDEGFLPSLRLNLKIEIGKTRVENVLFSPWLWQSQAWQVWHSLLLTKATFGDKPLKFNSRGS